MQVAITLQGKSPLVLHSRRLADPQDKYARAIKELTSKRKKTDADEAAIADLEWRGSLYYDSDNGSGQIYVPTWNIKRCFQEGAKVTREGKVIQRAFHPTTVTTPLVYDGPKDPAKLIEKPEFRWRTSVVINQSVVMRTRPIFRTWAVALEAMILDDMLNLRDLQRIAETAGTIEGLNEARTLGYGRFDVAIKEVK